MRIEFTVPGEPKGKGRPRFVKVGNYTKTYTPVDTVSYENLVKLEYQAQCGQVKFEKGIMLGLIVTACYAIPKSVSKKKQKQMLEGNIRPAKKPDMDNIIKIIADSLNHIAYYDDSQIVSAVVNKYYSDNPRVEVVIYEEQQNK